VDKLFLVFVKFRLRSQNIPAHAGAMSCEEGGDTMRARNNYYNNVIEINFGNLQIPVIQKGVAAEDEFNASFEGEIEYLWAQSRSRGWSYDDFVAHLLEVLTVVRSRDKIGLSSSPVRQVWRPDLL
jgi:hypothetical protein